MEVDVKTQRRDNDEAVDERDGRGDVGDGTEGVDGGEDFGHEDGEEGEVDTVFARSKRDGSQHLYGDRRRERYIEGSGNGVVELGTQGGSRRKDEPEDRFLQNFPRMRRRESTGEGRGREVTVGLFDRMHDLFEGEEAGLARRSEGRREGKGRKGAGVRIRKSPRTCSRR
jgi:hypothetical protein